MQLALNKSGYVARTTIHIHKETVIKGDTSHTHFIKAILMLSEPKTNIWKKSDCSGINTRGQHGKKIFEMLQKV